MLLKRRIVQLGSEHELTGMQTITIFLLDAPRPMHSFKTIFNCDASNVTGIIDGLEQKGLVSRYENRSDRRIKMIKLEAPGSRVRSQILKQLASDEDPIVSRLSAGEFQTFIGLVEKITAEPASPTL